MDLIITILPVVTKDLPILSPVHAFHFFYRDASSALLQLVNQWLNFYLLTFPRFPLRKKEHKSYFGKNQSHDFRTSRCAGYLLDHSGDEGSDTSIYSELGPNTGPAHLDSFDDGLIIETTDGATKTAYSAGTGRTPVVIAMLRQHYCIPTSECLRHTLVLVMAVRGGKEDEQQRHRADRIRARHVRSKSAYRQWFELSQSRVPT